MANLAPRSDYLWAHIILAFLFFPLSILFMKRFSRKVGFQEASNLELSKTIMIENIPKSQCHGKATLTTFFTEAFPDAAISDLRFAYDVEQCMSTYHQMIDANLSKEYCEKREGIKLYPVHCSRCCFVFCCCCVDRVEAKEFYTEEGVRLEEQFQEERKEALEEPLGIAFVTFEDINMSKTVVDAFRTHFFDCTYSPPESSVNDCLQPSKWNVNYAPPVQDIYWEHLSMGRKHLLVKKVIINICLFFVCFFLTTPEYLVSQTNFIVSFLGNEFALPPAIVDFLPTLMLWSFTAFLPTLVAWSDRFLGHWTRSAENHAIMLKTFWFLLFMVIFLPTFGFTTADAIFKFVLQEQNSDESYRWECVFLPDSGAFFVNYIITTAFVGEGLELIRFPELFLYFCQVCWSRSEADVPAIRYSIKYEFRFGEQYARLMLIFCMTMMYSLSCPLITPFGLLFFIFKVHSHGNCRSRLQHESAIKNQN